MHTVCSLCQVRPNHAKNLCSRCYRKTRPPSPLPKTYTNQKDDGRVKIAKELYPQVKQAYQELKSLRKVAALYGVDKRTIQFIVRPESLQNLKNRNKLISHHLIYYNTEKRRAYMRAYRAKKRALNLL